MVPTGWLVDTSSPRHSCRVRLLSLARHLAPAAAGMMNKEERRGGAAFFREASAAACFWLNLLLVCDPHAGDTSIYIWGCVVTGSSLRNVSDCVRPWQAYERVQVPDGGLSNASIAKRYDYLIGNLSYAGAGKYGGSIWNGSLSCASNAEH